jgi:murein L,D-transpeptidase YafK
MMQARSRRAALPLLLSLSLIACDLASAGAPSAAGGAGHGLVQADSVLVVKSERRLYLLHGGQVFRSYKIMLGLSPTGPKEREGDYRTPEGRYVLDLRNPHSDYFLAIHVSYPNDGDEAAARRHGWRTGGSIMIHGLPNLPHRPISFYKGVDWTDGCIALSNDDMLELWLLTGPETPIEIRP